MTDILTSLCVVCCFSFIQINAFILMAISHADNVINASIKNNRNIILICQALVGFKLLQFNVN
jgi:hypothetical protein